MTIINDAINFIYANLAQFEFASIFISGVMLFLVVYFNLKLGLTKEKLDHWWDVWNSKSIVARRSFKAWKRIQESLKSREESRWKFAVLESDRILDEALKLASYPGMAFDARLKSMDESQLSSIEEVRQVHRIRNRIAAEPDFVLTRGEAEIAVGIYRRAFIALGILEEGD